MKLKSVRKIINDRDVAVWVFIEKYLSPSVRKDIFYMSDQVIREMGSVYFMPKFLVYEELKARMVVG